MRATLRLACVLYLLVVSASFAADAPVSHWTLDSDHVKQDRLHSAKGDAEALIVGPIELASDPSSLKFDGKTNRVTISDDIVSSGLPSRALSVEAWTRVDRIQEWGGIVGAIQDNGSYERGWLLGFRRSKFFLAIASTTSQRLTYLTSKVDFVPGAWYHVCGTYDGKTMQLFVDGELAASSSDQSGDILYPPKTWFEIGAYHDDNELYPLAGQIAEVAIFDRAVAKKEVSQRFGQNKSRFPGVEPVVSEVVGWPTYMHDNERSGTTSERLTLPLQEAWRYIARLPPQPAWPPPANQDFWHKKHDLPARVTYDRAFHVVSDGTSICFGSSSADQVTCLDLASGSRNWVFFTEGPVRLAPTIDSGRVYVGSDDGSVYCLHLQTGELIWRHRAGEGDRRMPGNGRMISSWPVRTGVLVDSGQARFAAGLFPLQGTYQYASDGASGKELAKGKLAFSPQGYMQRRGETIMVAQGRAPATKLAPLKQTVKQKIAGTNAGAATKTDSYPFATIQAGGMRIGGGDGEVAVFDSAGTVAWKAAVEGKAYSLAVAGDSLLVSTDAGVIHCFQAKEIESPQVWDRRRSGPARNPSEDPRLASIQELDASDRGYCLIAADNPVPLGITLARRTQLQIVCAVPNTEHFTTLRQLIESAGLDGRVSVHVIPNDRLPYVPKLFNLIVLDRQHYRVSARDVYRLLRPGDGRAVVLWSPSDQPPRKEWVAELPEDEISIAADSVVVSRKPLDDAGHWTHIYASPDNSACSNDQHVGSELKLQWFGAPGPREMIDRHHRTVPPLYVDGKLFVPGNDRVYGVDAYNGTILWNSEVPNSRRVGAMRDAGSMAASREYLYVAAGDRCYGLESQSGAFALNFPVPVGTDKQPRDWGYVAYVGDRLLGSSTRPDASRDGHNRRQIDETYYDFVPVVTSDSVFSMDRFRGEVHWKYAAQGGAIINSTLTIGEGRVCFLESTNRETLLEKTGRSKLSDLLKGKAELVALDLLKGNVLWRQPFDLSELQHQVFLSYADGKLILVGTKNKVDDVRQLLWYDLHGFDAVTGAHVWSATQNQRLGVNGSHGEQDHHPTIVNGVVYQQPYAYDLHTGKRREGWQFARGGHGCGALSASAKAVYFRAGNPTLCDLRTGENHKITQVSRPGCWINIIPAGGLLMIPEASSGCTCNFPIQASIVFAPSEP